MSQQQKPQPAATGLEMRPDRATEFATGLVLLWQSAELNISSEDYDILADDIAEAFRDRGSSSVEPVHCRAEVQTDDLPPIPVQKKRNRVVGHGLSHDDPSCRSADRALELWCRDYDELREACRRIRTAALALLAEKDAEIAGLLADRADQVRRKRETHEAIAAAEARGAAQQKQRDVERLRRKAAEKRTMLSQVEAMKPDSFAVATINVIADDLDGIADALEAEAGKL
jgi:hypothetical protein